MRITVVAFRYLLMLLSNFLEKAQAAESVRKLSDFRGLSDLNGKYCMLKVRQIFRHRFSNLLRGGLQWILSFINRNKFIEILSWYGPELGSR